MLSDMVKMDKEDSFVIYKEAIDVLEKSGIPYVVGGGIAVMAFGRTRNTKDIDLYIEPHLRLVALNALKEAGFETDPMLDVSWLAKAFKCGIMIDFILENVGGIITTPETIGRGKYRSINGYRMHIMAPEDLIIRKIMAMRSDRNDWYDCMSVLSSSYQSIDWDYYIRLSDYGIERSLAFLLFASTDLEHVVPVPKWVIKALAEKL